MLRYFLFFIFFPLCLCDTDHTVVPILFMSISLLLLCFFMHILSVRAPFIPYTVAVFIIGILFSALADVNQLSAFHESLNVFVHIDANLVLYIFLPILIFGEAMNLNWHHVQVSGEGGREGERV